MKNHNKKRCQCKKPNPIKLVDLRSYQGNAIIYNHCQDCHSMIGPLKYEEDYRQYDERPLPKGYKMFRDVPRRFNGMRAEDYY